MWLLFEFGGIFSCNVLSFVLAESRKLLCWVVVVF